MSFSSPQSLCWSKVHPISKMFRHFDDSLTSADCQCLSETQKLLLVFNYNRIQHRPRRCRNIHSFLQLHSKAPCSETCSNSCFLSFCTVWFMHFSWLFTGVWMPYCFLYIILSIFTWSKAWGRIPVSTKIFY